jgi:hypothetical protein
MHGPINVKSPNNTRKWQMGFNSAFKGLIVDPGRLTLSVSAPVTQKMGVSVDLRAGVDVLETKVTSHLSGIELRIDKPLALSLRFPYRMSMVQKNA